MVSAEASLRSVTFGPGRSNPTSGLSSCNRGRRRRTLGLVTSSSLAWPATRRHASVRAIRCNASAFYCGSSPSIARNTSRATSTCGRRCSPRSAETGWRNYSLFIAEDSLVVGYLETDDFDASVRAMAETDVNARWQAEMTPFFELGGRAPDEGFALLDEYFHLD